MFDGFAKKHSLKKPENICKIQSKSTGSHGKKEMM